MQICSFHSYDEDLKLFISVSYFFINNTNITGLDNVTYNDFVNGYMPTLEQVQIPDDQMTEIYYEMEVSSSNCKYWSPFYENYVTDG